MDLKVSLKIEDHEFEGTVEEVRLLEGGRTRLELMFPSEVAQVYTKPGSARFYTRDYAPTVVTMSMVIETKHIQDKLKAYIGKMSEQKKLS